MFFFIVAFAVQIAYADYVVHEKRADIQLQQWHQGPRLSADTLIPVRIGLTQSNLDLGPDILMKISHPDSPSYGNHMTQDEVTSFFAPSNESIKAVTSWLVSAGVDLSRISISSNKQWIKFSGNASEVEGLLDSEYYVYQHKNDPRREDVASERYSVPQSIQRHIDYITPGVRLRADGKLSAHSTRRRGGSVQSRSTTATGGPKGSPPNCGHNVTPACIRAMYNISEANLAHPGNAMGFFEGFGQVFVQKQFDAWSKIYYPRIPQGFAPTQYSIDGASLVFNKSNDNGEVLLDVEVAVPIIYPQNFTIYQADLLDGSRGWFNPWLDAIDGSYCNYTAYGITGDSPGIDESYPNKEWPHPEQCGVYKPTNVISISYGEAEAGLPVNYVKRQCSEYLKLGLQGVSIFVCTQDNGVEGGVGDPNLVNDCLGKTGRIFAPTFPGSCPYITAVGATQYGPSANVLNHTLEVAATFSGGGFSNVWAAPGYQKKALSSFFKNHNPSQPSYSTTNSKNIGANGGIYNRAGRGFPDVAAIGNFIRAGGPGPNAFSSGTSASTPLWGAIFNRINEVRLAAGKSTVGFVNPALYTRPSNMHDILRGYNLGCPYTSRAFNVTKGWDPVTGLGSPDYPSLLEYFTNL